MKKFAIVFASFNYDEPLESHKIELLDESFDTKEEAEEFVNTLIEEDKLDTIDGEDEEDYDFDISRFEVDGVIEIDVESKFYGDISYINEYRIVEVK